jgi:SSS family solute:Na+ symporter
MVHSVPALVVLAYVIALFAVTVWATRHAGRRGGLVGYLLAGRQVPTPVTAAMLAGLAVGGASTIGVAEQAYQSGISAGWYNAAWAAGAVVMALACARRYRRLELTTINELLERHYDVTGRLLGVFGQIALQVVVTSLQYVAGGAILSSLVPGLFSFRTGMVATALVFIGITLIGGFWAAGVTNVINVGVIYLGVGVGVVLTLGEVGGLGALARALPADHAGFDLLGVGPAQILAWFLVMATTVVSMQSVVQISFAARDERSAERGFLWGALLILPIGFMSAIVGMAAVVLHPGIVPAEALPRTVLGLPPLVAGVVLAGLWAADVSTASALLVGSATLVSSDLVKRFVAPGLSPSRERLLCRASVAGIGAVTFALALSVSGILRVLLAGLTLSTAYTLIVLMTFFIPSLCRRSSAAWTLGATMISLAAWIAAPAGWRPVPHPIYLTWPVSLAVFFAVALFDRRPLRAAPTAGLAEAGRARSSESRAAASPASRCGREP